MITNLKKFLNSYIGQILASAILGFGLASIFRKSCENRNCLVFHAPSDLKQIEKDVYKYDGKCYKFKPTSMKCNKEKKILNFA